jgi:hypothetical protein
VILTFGVLAIGAMWGALVILYFVGRVLYKFLTPSAWDSYQPRKGQ